MQSGLVVTVVPPKGEPLLGSGEDWCPAYTVVWVEMACRIFKGDTRDIPDSRLFTALSGDGASQAHCVIYDAAFRFLAANPIAC